jgi:hypothetical protein
MSDRNLEALNETGHHDVQRCEFRDAEVYGVGVRARRIRA